MTTLCAHIGWSLTDSVVARRKQAITADTALRLGAFFGTTPQFWLRLQEGYDLAIARAGTPLSGIQPLTA